jgi:hypothetical protein
LVVVVQAVAVMVVVLAAVVVEVCTVRLQVFL